MTRSSLLCCDYKKVNKCCWWDFNTTQHASLFSCLMEDGRWRGGQPQITGNPLLLSKISLSDTHRNKLFPMQCSAYQGKQQMLTSVEWAADTSSKQADSQSGKLLAGTKAKLNTLAQSEISLKFFFGAFYAFFFLDSNSRDRTGNEGERDATKIPSRTWDRDIVVHGRGVNRWTTGPSAEKSLDNNWIVMKSATDISGTEIS